MKLLFKQKMFSWLDSYDVFGETGETLYKVKGKLDWGHCFKIYDAADNELATVKQKIFTWLPKFEMYYGDSFVSAGNLPFLGPNTTLIVTDGRLRATFLSGITVS